MNFNNCNKKNEKNIFVSQAIVVRISIEIQIFLFSLVIASSEHLSFVPDASGGSSGRRSGDRHPLEIFFFNFFSVETKKEEFWRLEYALKTVF